MKLFGRGWFWTGCLVPGGVGGPASGHTYAKHHDRVATDLSTLRDLPHRLAASGILVGEVVARGLALDLRSARQSQFVPHEFARCETCETRPKSKWPDSKPA